MRSEAIEAFGENRIALRVEFEWRQDRYGHTISLVDPQGAITPILRSMEGRKDDAWPPSPPLQTLAIEKLSDDRSVALLVGMAGRSHWSASIEPSQQCAGLLFDIACRHGEAPTNLGNQYQWLRESEKAITIRGIEAEVCDDGDKVVIAPWQKSRIGQTARWKYAVTLERANC